MSGTEEPGLPGILLHLSGPLQSWGEVSPFPAQRDTAATPTRSGLIGLIAAGLGYSRDDSRLGELGDLRFTVRVDRPGTLVRDLHTVGGGMPRHLTVATAEGKFRSGETSTLVSHRYYMQDAAFTVAAHSADIPLLHRCASALRWPTWPPYLGRRSCPPNAPFYLGTSPNVLRDLVRLPLARQGPREPAPRASDRTTPDERTVPPVAVDFTADSSLEALLRAVHAHAAQPDHRPPPEENVSEAHDDPISFVPLDRRYRSRRRHHITVRLPAAQCGGRGTAYLDRLTAHFDATPLEDLP